MCAHKLRLQHFFFRSVVDPTNQPGGCPPPPCSARRSPSPTPPMPREGETEEERALRKERERPLSPRMWITGR